ncbi:MAG: Clp protease N-terminal domain-containing protein, partial [Solirubrobacteraceae bacterium]
GNVRARLAERKRTDGEAGPEARPIPFAADASSAIELALREALGLGHSYVGSEHLLLGVARESSGLGARILHDRGLDAERLRVELVRLAGEPSARPARMGLGRANGPATAAPRGG